jgi:Uma2 family endonuclease
MIPQTNVFPQRTPLRFKVDEYYKLIELGMLHDYEKAEIIDGELIRHMTVGDRHAQVVDRLNRLLVRGLPDEVLVRVQNPVRLSDYNEPEPDILLSDLTKYDGSRHPRPAETLLIIEVSDSTLKYDRDTKLALYAEAEINEVWIVNLPKNIVEIHTKPNEGIYQTVKIIKLGETIKSDIIPDLEIEIDKILG